MIDDEAERNLRMELMAADIENKRADTDYKRVSIDYKRGLLRFEPWKIVTGAFGAGAAVMLAAITFAKWWISGG